MKLTQAAAQRMIAAECDALKAMLLRKNEDYGNSALDPMRVASKASAEEQILVRIDDKLSRLAKGGHAGEDVWLDLMGYIVLLRVCRRASSERVDGLNTLPRPMPEKAIVDLEKPIPVPASLSASEKILWDALMKEWKVIGRMEGFQASPQTGLRRHHDACHRSQRPGLSEEDAWTCVPACRAGEAG